jgi:hypothetical protein
MRRNAYKSDTTIVVAYDDEPATEVFSRIVSETTPPVIVAIPRESNSWGFVFMTIVSAEQTPSTDEDGDHDNVGQAASIGMLYDTMAAEHKHKTLLTVPNDWRPATFRVELAALDS